MQTYYPSLESIHQKTLQLEPEQCPHCRQTRQLVSHGFIRKKRVGRDPQAVGKRVFCSNRRHRTGCGRTLQLYLDSTLRHFHRTGLHPSHRHGHPSPCLSMVASPGRTNQFLPQPVPSAAVGRAGIYGATSPIAPQPVGFNLFGAAGALWPAAVPGLSSAIATPLLLTPSMPSSPLFAQLPSYLAMPKH